MKDSATIVGTAVYIVVNVKHSFVFLHLQVNTATSTDKNCSEFNFLQKIQWAHVSISSSMELGGSKDCHV